MLAEPFGRQWVEIGKKEGAVRDGTGIDPGENLLFRIQVKSQYVFQLFKFRLSFEFLTRLFDFRLFRSRPTFMF